MNTEAMDMAAWVRSLLDEYEQPLVRYAARFLRDHEAARDVVQDVFLRLVAADRRTVEGHAAEWLFTVCRNRCLDIARKERRMTTMSEQTSAALSHRETLSPSLEHSDHAGSVLRLLDALPERQQEVIRLRFQNGLSYREISRVTQLTVTNVGFLIHTGLKTVRERLAAQVGCAARANLGTAR